MSQVYHSPEFTSDPVSYCSPRCRERGITCDVCTAPKRRARPTPRPVQKHRDPLRHKPFERITER